MKNQAKLLLKAAGISAILTVVPILAGLALGHIINSEQKINMLKRELRQAKEYSTSIELQRDDYRKQLIKHGNPEGWKECYDEFAQQKYYTRENGDGIEGYWTEYLK
jgi:hypothetical protein